MLDLSCLQRSPHSTEKSRGRLRQTREREQAAFAGLQLGSPDLQGTVGRHWILSTQLKGGTHSHIYSVFSETHTQPCFHMNIASLFSILDHILTKYELCEGQNRQLPYETKMETNSILI